MRVALTIGAVVLCVACHNAPSDPGGPGGPDIDGSVGSGGGGSDASVPEGFTTLISRSWTIASNTEAYKCVRMQVPTDMWITAFHSISPVGTHHSVLTISTNSTMVGEYNCDAGSLDSEMLYAAGVNTDDNDFPAGVAIHVAAGTYVNLNLHLFNTTDNPITGTSGVMVKNIAQADVQNEADMQFSGTFIISVPNDGQVHTATGGCNVAHDFHMFTLWPHMHQTATHQTLTVTPSGGTAATLLDTDYEFGNQKNYPITDTLVPAGAHISTTCTYVNNTDHAESFSESSDQEMCFTGIYRYPAGGNLFACAMGQSI
ncbi:MAG: hypothetical protein ABI591_23835 [Kofleriaceae bacterium]